jgi:hypothetical protein
MALARRRPGHFMIHVALSLDPAEDQLELATEWDTHLTADEYPGR